MKIFFTSFIALILTINCFAQGKADSPRFGPSSNIGKSTDNCIFSPDSIPLFLIKGDGKSKKIAPDKVLELSTKNNCLLNVIPVEAIKQVFVYKNTKETRKYGKDGTYGVYEIHLLDNKAGAILKLLKDKGYLK